MTKTYTRKEVEERDRKTCLFVIDNLVYDVTPFLDEHPGGHEVLQNVAGRDASEDFDDIGHSLDAKELMKKYVVGEVAEADRRPLRKRAAAWDAGAGGQHAGEGGAAWKLPLLLALLATVLYAYYFA